jgi:GT2 family glycosyltransferase
MKISVAIPTLGRETLHATLRSLERQTVQPHEILVVNQGPPELDDELKKYRLPLRHLPQQARGLSRARNRALSEFAGDWVLFTDDDQEVNAEWVEQLAALIETYPEASMFGGVVLPPIKYDPSTEFVSQMYVAGEVILNRERYLQPPPGPNMPNDIWGGNFALSRQCIETVGHYDEHLGRGSGLCEAGEDTDYAIRALTKGLVGVLSCRLIITHTYGVRPIMESTERELVEVAAMIAWKSAQDPSSVAPELATKFHPFGRKKALLSDLTRGIVFHDHAWRKGVYDAFCERLSSGYRVQGGVIVAKSE